MVLRPARRLWSVTTQVPLVDRVYPRAYVNPNGALFFDPSPPCGGFFATDSRGGRADAVSLAATSPRHEPSLVATSPRLHVEGRRRVRSPPGRTDAVRRPPSDAASKPVASPTERGSRRLGGSTPRRGPGSSADESRPSDAGNINRPSPTPEYHRRRGSERRARRCTLETSWRVGVLAFATDLDPREGAGAVAAAAPGPGGSAVAARWSDVALFASAATVSVGAAAYGDGRLEILHETVVDARGGRAP